MTKALILLTIAVISLACGVVTVAAPPKVLTSTPVIHTSPMKVLTQNTATNAPDTRVVCNGDIVNARGVADDMTLAVIARLPAGEIVTLTGDVFADAAGELWQPTDRGLVDPRFLCFEHKH